jgi:hypothetical protein
MNKSKKDKKYLNSYLLDNDMNKKISRSTIQRIMVLALLEQLGKDTTICDNCKEKLERGQGRRVILIHHIDNNPLNNKVENLQILCNACHGLTTHFKDRKGKLNGNYKGLIFITNCDYCKKEFLCKDYSHSKNHFCSQKCYKDYQKDFRVKSNCLKCGKEILSPKSIKRDYCSLKCFYDRSKK